MSALKKRNVSFYDAKRNESLTLEVPPGDFIEKIFGVGLSASDTVLDIGCGVCSHLLSLDCGMKVGLDIARGNLDVAKNRSKTIHLVRGDAESLPFKNNAFSTILIVSLLHHLSNHERALSEVGRVCRERSHLFICDSSVTGIRPIYPLAIIIRYLASMLKSPESFGPTFDKLHFVLKANNFGIVQIKISMTFILYLYVALRSFVHRFRGLPMGTKLYELLERQESLARSLDARVFLKTGGRFGVWFNLFAVKSKGFTR